MNSTAWPTEEFASGGVGGDTDGSDIFQNNVKDQTEALSCYSGIFGTCNTCNMQGSCICASRLNGHSDFIPMDRRRWGERVLTCPNYEPVLVAFYAIAAVTSLLCGLRAVWALKSRINDAGQQSREEKTAIVALTWVLGSVVLNAALNIVKIALPDLLVGIDLIPSAFRFGRELAMCVADNLRVLRLFKIAFKAQEASVGRQRVAEKNVRHTQNFYFKVCLFGALSLPVVVGALLVEFGYVRSTQSQIILLFTNNLLDVLRMLITIGLSLYEGHKLKLEFEKSISAVEAARVVAAGGVAAMAVHISQSTTRASGDSHVAVQTMPPQLLALDEELKMLKASNQSLDPIGPGQKGAVIFMVTALVLSCAVPRLWNKASYILILRSVLLPALALRIARRFTRAPYPRENIVQRI